MKKKDDGFCLRFDEKLINLSLVFDRKISSELYSDLFGYWKSGQITNKIVTRTNDSAKTNKHRY